MTTAREMLVSGRIPARRRGWISRVSAGLLRHISGFFRHNPGLLRHAPEFLRPWFLPRTIKRRRFLDVCELSPHLLRDLGVLDGNDPRGRRG